jgi:molecular chaperone GrpE (heat shock protein)
MAIDKKIISEIRRYHSINNYILEQDAFAADDAAPPPPAPPATDDATVPGLPPAQAPTPEAPPTPIDVESDPDVEKIDDVGKSEETSDESGTEELEITDLVKSQETIETKQEEYFNNLFSQISNLESKLGEMDSIINKLNAIETKIEKYREKTPQEKLELRTYDSYPFNQKLSDFFDDKKEEMEKTGKRDYVLTSDEVTDINDKEMKDSFLPPIEGEL